MEIKVYKLELEDRNTNHKVCALRYASRAHASTVGGESIQSTNSTTLIFATYSTYHSIERSTGKEAMPLWNKAGLIIIQHLQAHVL